MRLPGKLILASADVATGACDWLFGFTRMWERWDMDADGVHRVVGARRTHRLFAAGSSFVSSFL